MNWNLKTRMTAAISLLTVLLLAGMAILYLAYFARELRTSISAQQFTLVTALAAEIDHKIAGARDQLVAVAASLPPASLDRPERLQIFLQQRPALKVLFGNGLYLFSAEGTLLAGVPRQPEMIGRNFSHRPYFQQTLREKRPVISDPFPSAQSHGHPIVMFTAPIFDPAGELAGVLVGSLDLLGENFLEHLAAVRLGREGFLCLIDPQGRAIVHPRPEAILSTDAAELRPPPAEVAPGFAGTLDQVTPEGIRVFSAFAWLQEKEWLLTASYPIAEVYAPVKHAWLYGLLALGLGAAVSLLTVWLLMRRLTAPLLDLTDRVRAFGRQPENGVLEPLPPFRQDEIGLLAQAFNDMRREIVNRNKALELAWDFHLSLFEEFPTLVCRTDRSGGGDYFNRTWLDFTGRTADQEQGSGWLAGVHPEDREHCRQKLAEALAGQSPFTQEFRLRHRQGSWRWILWSGRPFVDLSGTFAGFLGSGLDITDRRLILDQLRRLSLAVEQSPTAVIITDTRGQIEYINPRFTETTGYPLTEILGRNLGFLGFEEAARAEYCRIWQLLLQGRTWHGELCHRRRSGELYWESVDISPVRDAGGEITHFVAVAEEVTEQKRAREDSARRQLLLEAINTAFIRFLQSGRIADLAFHLVESCRQVLGAGGGIVCDLQGARLLAKSGTLPAFLTWAADEEGECIQLHSGCGKMLRHLQEEPSLLLNTSPDAEPGTEAPLFASVLAVPLRIAQETLGVLALFDKAGGFSENDRSILEIFSQTAALALQSARTEKARQEATDHLRVVQKFEAIGQLASGVAHDFNNLLTVINGYCSLLIRSLKHQPEQRADVELILKAGQKAENLTRQLLAFSKQQVLEPVVLDLNELIGGFGKILRRLVRENIELHWRLAPELGRVLADPSQLEQILINLVVNARDAIAEGGEIVVETGNFTIDGAFTRRHQGVAPGDYVRLGVSDNGCGMSGEVCSRIFEPFFSTKPKGTGTGLGLATVYGIVKQSGGYITVDSRPGAGTRFDLYLPREQRQLPTGSRRPEPLQARGCGIILLVEDEGAVLQLTAELLRGHGYTVLPVPGPAEALQRYEETGRIDLLLTDLGMPGMSGAELARLLQQRQPELKVLFMSGYSEFHGRGLGESDPASGFLQKPFSPEALIEKVQGFLANQTGQGEQKE